MSRHPCPPPDDRAIRPGDHVGCGELPLLGRVERLAPKTAREPEGAHVLILRTLWRGFGDGTGGYTTRWPLRQLHVVDIGSFEYCPTRDRYYPREVYRPVPPAVPRLRLDVEAGPHGDCTECDWILGRDRQRRIAAARREAP